MPRTHVSSLLGLLALVGCGGDDGGNHAAACTEPDRSRLPALPDEVAPGECEQALSRCIAIGACADGLCPAGLEPEQAEAWLEYCDWHVFCECDAEGSLNSGSAGSAGDGSGGAGTGASSGGAGGEPPTGSSEPTSTGDDPNLCSEVCHKSIDCGDDDFASADECIEMCRELGTSGATAECPDALRASNECGAALDCEAFLEFSMQGPGEDYPCKAQYDALVAACR